MTREEAEWIMHMCRDRDARTKAERDAFDMAIEALTYKNPQKPNNTCEVDLISRKDAMGAVQDHFSADGFKGYYDGQKMMDRITALPSADMRGETE